jgi:hypothetical protein
MSEVGGRVIHMTPAALAETEPGAPQLLDFERAHPRHSGHKETAIIETLGLAPARYYVLLKRAAESIEGQAHDAITSHRVLRREERIAAATAEYVRSWFDQRERRLRTS